MEPALQPPELRPPGTTTAQQDPGSVSDGSRSRLMWILISLFVVLAFAVLVILPSLVNRDTDSKLPGTPTTSTSLNQQTAPEPSVARHDAELALQDFLRMRAHPDLGNAQVWAANEWQHALETADTGDDHHGHGRFDQASSAYQDALNQLSILLESRPQRLQDALSTAEQLLEQNQGGKAVTAFERALALQPGHAQATAGLKRASVRDQVIDSIEKGQQLEKAQKTDLAIDAYRAAVMLDPIYTPARESLQSAERVLADMNYQESMSDALSQLDQGNLAAAAEALDTASKIRPGSPEIKDARQRLDETRRLRSLSRLREQAKLQVSTEQWAEAAASYRSALKIDSQATFATIGLEKAEERLQLHAQFDHYLSDPDRLASNEPIFNAKELLRVNDKIPVDEPKLNSKVHRLQEIVRLAELPITLTIQSDNQTEITIYHVGRLGKFLNRQVSLRPGRYTVTGYCPGYRDVRKVVTLRPNANENHLLVRCEEKI